MQDREELQENYTSYWFILSLGHVWILKFVLSFCQLLMSLPKQQFDKFWLFMSLKRHKLTLAIKL